MSSVCCSSFPWGQNHVPVEINSTLHSCFTTPLSRPVPLPRTD